MRHGGLDDASAKTAESLQTLLTSKAASAALAEAGFRPATSETPQAELVPGIPATLPTSAVTLTAPDFGQILRDMQRIVRKQTVLIVVDVSGSMLEPVGAGTRIDVAVKAINDSMAQLPDDARAGLWVFSSDRGKNNRDWEKILGVAELGPAGKAGGERAKLTAAAKSMPSMLRGDTGLYDTILAAYESALADFKEGSESVVIVITDGENDDPTGGLSEKSLVTKLKAAQDDKRPVRLALIGMGPSTDVQTMRRVTGAIGGRTAVAANPADITGVFASAMWTVAKQPQK